MMTSIRFLLQALQVLLRDSIYILYGMGLFLLHLETIRNYYSFRGLLEYINIRFFVGIINNRIDCINW